MKRRISIMLVLMALALMLGASALALADSPGKVTGGGQFTMELYAPYPHIEWTRAWAEFNVLQVEPWVDADGQTHDAKGWMRFKTYHENTGWLSARVEVSCVAFGEDDGVPFAVTSGKVVGVDGLDPSALGTYWVHKVYDGGTPGREGDAFGYYAGDAFPGWSYDPVCNVPEGGPDYSTGLHYEYPIERGNLVIHH